MTKVSRDKIIHAARELFREKGYAGASMQDLADEVGLRKASLYMRFPNKESLVPEVLDSTLEETFDIPDIDRVEWRKAFEMIVLSIAKSLSERKRCVGFHLAYGIGEDTPLAKQAVKDFFQGHRDRMTEVLEKGMPREKAEILAADALVRLEGATLLLALFDEREAMDRAVSATLDSLPEPGKR
ncbi:TetR/AcrR family transcriptional regulator [Agrobacterium larrymoorei]|uniref:TetR/AcrR family transcriptional regulator n=1 Tax=Agrobacterium larrymoorei TaxID=160699 RepID=UPI001573F520|nr:TetR/AcrR family transcriptional regulator [Agrobacterium larrymoorei]NTJ42795.1 TetR/AcrR family transcriptional regulator [Agrobacterium larrymoorei]